MAVAVRWFNTNRRYSTSRAGMRLASAAMARTSRLFMNVSNAGLAARIAPRRMGRMRWRRAVEADHGARIATSQCVVDQDREQICVARRLCADDDESGLSCAAVAVSNASYSCERGPSTAPSSSWMTNAGDKPSAVVASALSARYDVPNSEHVRTFALSRILIARLKSAFILTILAASPKISAA